MRAKKVIITAGIVILLVISVVYVSKRFPYVTGYSAKYLCSSVFISGRDSDDVINSDLGYSYFKYVDYDIDYENKTVETTLLGIAKQTATYREYFGCAVLLNKEHDVVDYELNIECPDHDDYDTIPWPQGDKIDSIHFDNIDYHKVHAAVDKAFIQPDKDLATGTRALIVLYDSIIIAEKYANKFDQDMPLLGWSMNKSIINALIGILVRQEKLDIYDFAPVPEWQSDERKNITINSLMHLSSGLEWEENYADISHATKMFYESGNVYNYSIGVPALEERDSVFYYSSGSVNILSGIIRNVLGSDSLYYQFPYNELFHKIGMRSMVLETDQAGTFVGSSYGFATARDWARFGLLYLNDGKWCGEQILPEGWVDYSREPAIASVLSYGALFWINQNKYFPDLPKDMFSSNGYQGQYMAIIPSRNLVVVRLGFNPHEKFDLNGFIFEILQAIE